VRDLVAQDDLEDGAACVYIRAAVYPVMRCQRVGL
jgi:hypothetical protein